MIQGIGIDVVEVARLRASVERRGERFLRRVFTPEEVAFCTSRPRRYEHLAARFAAKEAVLKALGTGLSGGASLLEVEVVHTAEGRPAVRLHGRTQDLARSLGVGRIHLSLTHTEHLAVAQALAERAT